MTQFCVAIDGPAAAGKGTISRALSARFGFAYLDTGLLYRAVARLVLDGADPVDAAKGLDPDDTTRGDLRTAQIAQAASKVAVIPEVRKALVKVQRDFAVRPGGAILDGRDIGTVICPEAQVKLFVTASDEVRAERRFRELSERGADTTLDQVLADVRARDARDRARATAPMRAAPDAVMLDTSDLTIDQAVDSAIAEVEAKLPA